MVVKGRVVFPLHLLILGIAAAAAVRARTEGTLENFVLSNLGRSRIERYPRTGRGMVNECGG
jgi:hypothetical protein